MREEKEVKNVLERRDQQQEEKRYYSKPDRATWPRAEPQGWFLRRSLQKKLDM